MKKLVGVAVLTLALTAHGMEKESHGGDPLVAEFLEAGRQVVSRLRQRESESASAEVSANMLDWALENATIFSGENVRVKGVPKIAVNTPEDHTIQIDRRGWSTLEGDRRRQALVVHELLPILGFSDADYSLSSKILSQAFGADENLTRGCTERMSSYEKDRSWMFSVQLKRVGGVWEVWYFAHRQLEGMAPVRAVSMKVGTFTLCEKSPLHGTRELYCVGAEGEWMIWRQEHYFGKPVALERVEVETPLTRALLQGHHHLRLGEESTLKPIRLGESWERKLLVGHLPSWGDNRGMQTFGAWTTRFRTDMCGAK